MLHGAKYTKMVLCPNLLLANADGTGSYRRIAPQEHGLHNITRPFNMFHNGVYSNTVQSIAFNHGDLFGSFDDPVTEHFPFSLGNKVDLRDDCNIGKGEHGTDFIRQVHAARCLKDYYPERIFDVRRASQTETGGFNEEIITS